MDEETYFQNLVSNSLDGTLTELEREKLAAHLKECKACAALKQDLEQIRAAFLADSTEEKENSAIFPPDLHQKIMQRVEQEQRLTVVRPEKPVRRMPVFTMVAAAAIVVLMVLGGGLGNLFSMTDTVDRTASGAVTSDTGDGAAHAATGARNMQENAKATTEDAPIAPSGNESANENNMNAITKKNGNNNIAPQSSDYARKSENSSVDFSDAAISAAPDAEDNVSEEDIALAQIPLEANDTTGMMKNSLDASLETAPNAAYNPDEAQKESRQTTTESDMDGGAESEQNVSIENWIYEQDEAPMITLPNSLLGNEVAHCYIAWGASGLPNLTGDLNLLLTADGVSYFSLPNEVNVMAETLDAMEQAGYQVESYESAGLEIDKKADAWLLIVVESE